MVRRDVGLNAILHVHGRFVLPEALQERRLLRRVAVEAEVLRIEQRLPRDERLEARKHIAAVQPQGERVVAHVERVVVRAERDVVVPAHMDRVLGYLIAVHVLRARKKQGAAERAGVGNLHLRTVGLRQSAAASRATFAPWFRGTGASPPSRSGSSRSTRLDCGRSRGSTAPGSEARLRRRCCSHRCARSCPGR